MTTRDHILDRVAQIPMLPASTTRLLPLLQNPETPVQAICVVIETDPSLAANVLKLANSAVFGGRGNIDSVRAAVIRLGRQQLSGMIVASSVGPRLAGAVEGYRLAPGDLWCHDIAVALATEELQKRLALHAAPGAVAAGLLVDVGKTVLGQFVSADEKAITAAAYERGMSFEEAEAHALGIDHAEAGATLLQRWGLPESIVQAVRWHHAPERCAPEHRATVDLVHAADQICTLAGFGGGEDGNQYRPCEAVMQRLGIEIDLVGEILAGVGVRLEQTLAELAK